VMLGILASHLRLNRRSQRWHALGVCHQCIFREARGHLDATVVGQTGLDGEACLPHLRTSRAERVFVPNNCSKVSSPSLGQSTACLADRRRAPRRLTACLSLPRLCQIAGELQDEERESAFEAGARVLLLGFASPMRRTYLVGQIKSFVGAPVEKADPTSLV
jgi:hypothetical protein